MKTSPALRTPGWEVRRLVLLDGSVLETDRIVEVTERVSGEGGYIKVEEVTRFDGKVDVGQHEVRL